MPSRWHGELLHQSISVEQAKHGGEERKKVNERDRGGIETGEKWRREGEGGRGRGRLGERHEGERRGRGRGRWRGRGGGERDWGRDMREREEKERLSARQRLTETQLYTDRDEVTYTGIDIYRQGR